MHPAPYRGVSDQRLQTQGGEWWPGHDLASEMRCEGPAVQAAERPARRRRVEGPDGQKPVFLSEERRPSAWSSTVV